MTRTPVGVVAIALIATAACGGLIAQDIGDDMATPEVPVDGVVDRADPLSTASGQRRPPNTDASAIAPDASALAPSSPPDASALAPSCPPDASALAPSCPPKDASSEPGTTLWAHAFGAPGGPPYGVNYAPAALA